jgi:DNA-binding transcriptional LysR family regulator
LPAWAWPHAQVHGRDRDQPGAVACAVPLAVKSPQSYYLVYPEKNAGKAAILKFREWILGEAQGG